MVACVWYVYSLIYRGPFKEYFLLFIFYFFATSYNWNMFDTKTKLIM